MQTASAQKNNLHEKCCSFFSLCLFYSSFVLLCLTISDLLFLFEHEIWITIGRIKIKLSTIMLSVYSESIEKRIALF